MKQPLPSGARLVLLLGVIAGAGLGTTGCMAPVGADKTTPLQAYHQIHQNALNGSQLSPETMSVLHRFDQVEQFAKAPDAALAAMHQKAMQSRDRNLLFALSELNYLAAERLRRSVKPWEPRDARDYYLASAVYAWFFLFGDAAGAPPGSFDQRFRTACDLYNCGLGWALTERRSTNAVAVLAGGPRRLPLGGLHLEFTQKDFPGSLADIEKFIIADRFLVRGLSLRNRQAGLGATLIAVSRKDPRIKMARSAPATVFLRINSNLSDLAEGRCRGALELYSGFEATTIQVGERAVPLETDTTVPLAYTLNQSLLWQLGRMQFLSFEERIPTDVYLTQPYQPGKVPVVFVHGTFSSPVYWAEMGNTLYADPELRKRCQFWQFIYNSGNPTVFSAMKLRESLEAKLRDLDPEGKDAALKQIVVIGHSQGGLVTKLTATDTGDRLLQLVVKTNRLEDLNLTGEQQALICRYTCFEALPCVKRVIFIATPHRGSYLAGNFARNLAQRFVRLPSMVLNASKELAGLAEKLNVPRVARNAPTSLDSMSPKNPALLELAEIPLAPGIKGHSIIPVLGEGDFKTGRDGLVEYRSAHVDYVESELIVRGPHSCQRLPGTIEEVRRILHEHVSSLAPGETQAPGAGGR